MYLNHKEMSEVEFGSAITSHSKVLMGFAMKLT
ncbi:MAG: hypothetical protein ACI8QD_001775, partial [Cyclobacteriaceae bacterium]